jgi:hypothetical protein
MAIKDTEVPFSLIDRDGVVKMAAIRELGFNERGAFIIAGYNSPPPEPRGGYFTGLPISPIEYRRRSRTQTAFARKAAQLIIWDDWGTPYSIVAPAHILDTLVAECIANEIPVRED